MKRSKQKLYIMIFCLVLTVFGISACTIADKEDPGEAKPLAQEEIDVPITVTREELNRYAMQSSAIWEFLQRFYTDTIIYRDDEGNYIYEPVNFELPLSDYNWDNLIQLDKTYKELEYIENGKILSIKGIDISRYQKAIDWAKVAADGVKYAMIRVGYRGYDQGGLVKDDLFDSNVSNALKNKVAVGAYFVTQAISVEEAVEEAKFVLANIRAYNITWPIVLDMEDSVSSSVRTASLTKEEWTDVAVAFCQTIKEAGYTPMLYCNIGWYMKKLDITRLTDYEKWFAQYFNRPFFPYEFWMWQYTNSGRVQGIVGNVDLNICFKDYSNPDRDEFGE